MESCQKNAGDAPKKVSLKIEVETLIERIEADLPTFCSRTKARQARSIVKGLRRGRWPDFVLDVLTELAASPSDHVELVMDRVAHRRRSARARFPTEAQRRVCEKPLTDTELDQNLSAYDADDVRVGRNRPPRWSPDDI